MPHPEKITINDKVQLTLLPAGYTLHVDGKDYPDNWFEPGDTPTRIELLEAAKEQICIILGDIDGDIPDDFIEILESIE
jgi:hypothetical protein